MATASKHRVLIIDDEPTVARAMARLLRHQFEVTTTTSPSEGLACLEETDTIAVVIADMCMPEMGGIELLARASKVRPETARVLLTATTDAPAAIDAVRTGAIARYLSKPCPAADLIGALEACAAMYERAHGGESDGNSESRESGTA